MKIKYKIAATFSLIVALIIGVISIFIYLLVDHHIHDQFDKRLLERSFTAAEISLERDELSESKYRNLTRQYLRNLPGEEEHFFRVVDGKPLPGKQKNKFFKASVFKESIEKGYAFFEIEDWQAAAIYYEDNQGDYIVVVTARDLEGIEQLNYLKQVLWLITLGSMVLVGMIALLFARIILKPINSMIRKVRRINASNLDVRLDEGNGKDEISRLSRTFNEMLDRIGASFESQKKFIQNASHELRTPLTVILGEADYVLHSSAQEKKQESIEKIYNEATHLNQLLGSLLHLSEVQSQKPNAGFEIFRLDEWIQKIVIRFNKQENENRIKIEYLNIKEVQENSFEILGNKLWIEMAIANILKNALKYSDGKPVSVTFTPSAKYSLVEIEDFGMGIDSSELDKIFTPFYRGKNTAYKKGHGIGLALAANIVEIHKGKIKIQSKPNKGTRVSLKFPKFRL